VELVIRGYPRLPSRGTLAFYPRRGRVIAAEGEIRARGRPRARALQRGPEIEN